MALDPETEERIEQPVSAEAERETRLTPTEAVAQMRINVPARGNRKLRTVIERANGEEHAGPASYGTTRGAVSRTRGLRPCVRLK